MSTDSTHEMRFSCHCGAIKIVARGPKPSHINECMCSLCRKHGAALVYYPTDQVKVTKNGETKGYLWGDKECEYTWCVACGCLVYWWPTEKYSEDEVGINARCIDNLDDLKYIEWRVTWDMAQKVLPGVYDVNGPVKKDAT